MRNLNFKPMTPKTKSLFHIILFFLVVNSAFSQIDLGSIHNFTLFTGNGALDNTAYSQIRGDIGTNAGLISGFPSGSVLFGNEHNANAITAQAVIDLEAAVAQIIAMPGTTTVAHTPCYGDFVGGETFYPGVYKQAGAVSICGKIILDAQGDPNAMFIFNFEGALDTYSGASVVLIGCASPANVFFLSGGAISLATNTTMVGNLISSPAGAVHGAASANLIGRMLSSNGSISVAADVNVDNGVPPIGPITQPTCKQPTGSFLIENHNWGNTYTFTPHPPDLTISSSGLVETQYQGTFTFTVQYSGECSISPPRVIVFSEYINYWLGTTSSDWNIDDNWSCGVPRLNEWINIIPVIAPQYPYPIISFTGGWGGSSGLAKNLEIEEGATCTVDNLSLRLTTILTHYGKIYLEGEGQLLQDTGSVLVGDGSLEVTQQGTGNSFRYNYWSSPVNSRGTDFTIGEVLRDGTDLDYIIDIDFGTDYTYADGAQTSPSSAIKLSSYWMYKLEDSGLGYSAWANVGNTEEVKVGQGYSMKGSNTSEEEQNYTFEGKPNNEVIELTISANNLHLVGNPYPSAIDANKFITDNGSTTGAIYYWEHYGGDTHLLSGYQGGYATYTNAGGTPASSNPRVSTLGASVKGAPKRYIPVGQGFFVVGDQNGGQIEFNNSQRVFQKESQGYSIFMRTDNSKTTTSNNSGNDLRPKFRIGFDAPQISHRQILLTLDENTTDRVDFGYDAEMIEVFDDDMYWVVDDKKYVIQATNEFGFDKEIPLGIQTKKGGLIRIKIDELENTEEYPFLYIKDSLTGETHDITNQDFEINLEAGEYLNRFFLVTQATLNITEEVTLLDGVQVYMNNSISELQLNRLVDTEILNVSVFNYLGQQVKTWSINTDERFISLPLKIVTGTYIVKVETTNGNVNKKIIIIN
jgi:hypothetical protein